MNQSKWDYYDEKLLRTLVIRFAFDFKKISEFFSRNNKSKNFSAKECQKKWTQLSRNKTKSSSRFESLVKDLPESRTQRDYLKVTPEDLKKEQTLLEDGTLSYPNGTRLLYVYKLF
jgi:hypothetical protein